MRLGAAIAAAVAVCLAAVVWDNPQRASPDLAPTAPIFPFFAYVLNSHPKAALVAFSPTHHDPRPGVHRQVPSADALQADLAALRPAFDGLILYGYDQDITVLWYFPG